MALFERVLCEQGSAIFNETTAVFQRNRNALAGEPLYATLIQPFENAVAALLSMSTEMQTQVISGVGLTGDYDVVDWGAKAAGEPLSAQGDPDFDGLPNFVEYTSAQGSGGDAEYYAIVALDGLQDGTGMDAAPTATYTGLMILAGFLACIGLALLVAPTVVRSRR